MKLDWKKKKDRELNREKYYCTLTGRKYTMPSKQDRISWYPEHRMLYLGVGIEVPFRVNHQRVYPKVLRYLHSIFGTSKREILKINPSLKSSRQANKYFFNRIEYYTILPERPAEVPDLMKDLEEILETEELYFRRYSFTTENYEVLRWDELTNYEFSTASKRAFEGNPEKEFQSGYLWSTCSAERAAMEWVPRAEREDDLDDQQPPIRKVKRKPAAECVFWN